MVRMSSDERTVNQPNSATPAEIATPVPNAGTAADAPVTAPTVPSSCAKDFANFATLASTESPSIFRACSFACDHLRSMASSTAASTTSPIRPTPLWSDRTTGGLAGRFGSATCPTYAGMRHGVPLHAASR